MDIQEEASILRQQAHTPLEKLEGRNGDEMRCVFHSDYAELTLHLSSFMVSGAFEAVHLLDLSRGRRVSLFLEWRISSEV